MTTPIKPPLRPSERLTELFFEKYQDCAAVYQHSDPMRCKVDSQWRALLAYFDEYQDSVRPIAIARAQPTRPCAYGGGRCSECGNLPQDGHSLTCSKTFHVSDPVAHPAPTSSPGEDGDFIVSTLANHDCPYEARAALSRILARLAVSKARCDQLTKELERVRAENARLEKEAASWESACSVAMAHNDKLATESERLVSELREKLQHQCRLNTTLIEQNAKVITHNSELERLVSELRAELAQTEAERLKLLKYYGQAPDSDPPGSESEG
jgi:hypothetical protein